MARDHRGVRHGAALYAAILILSCALTGVSKAQTITPRKWVGSWASSQQIPEPENALSPADLHDATLRQIVHLSIGGSELRVHLSNAFGVEQLQVASAHIARPLSRETGSIDATTDRVLTFSGKPDVTIPAGAEYISDPVNFPVAPLSDLAITLYLEAPPAQQTSHPGSRETSFLVHGDQVSAANMPDAERFDHWFFISGVDVETNDPEAGAIVTLGNSITDGHASTANGDDRWPDDLASRLQSSPETKMLSVLNGGTGGNRLLLDGLGPNALARFDRDVLARAGVRYLIVLEGINDLGMATREQELSAAEHKELVENLIGSYRQIILRAHAASIKVIGGTISPDDGSGFYHPSAADDADRRAINAWIRTPGHFDAVIDFDTVLRDPSHPDQLLGAYDSGDHLHPSPAGYRAMANAIPLSYFTQ